jgi:hypothetical protein
MRSYGILQVSKGSSSKEYGTLLMHKVKIFHTYNIILFIDHSV